MFTLEFSEMVAEHLGELRVFDRKPILDQTAVRSLSDGWIKHFDRWLVSFQRIAMPSPFPGMDPYLESPEIFPDFHDSFVTYLRETLQASLPAPYFAALGRRLWIEVSRRSTGPDVEVRRTSGPSARRMEPAATVAIADQPVARPVVVKVAHDEFREPFVEIYARHDTGKRLVTSIEVLSLSNKTPGEHRRDLYVRKQKERLGSQVHLVEIDLLRSGEHVTAGPLDLAEDACGTFDYHVSVHHFDDFETSLVYPIRLEDQLLSLAVPLLPGDPSVTINVQSVFNRCYDAGPYFGEIRYDEDVLNPPLRADQTAWAARILEGERG